MAQALTTYPLLGPGFSMGWAIPLEFALPAWYVTGHPLPFEWPSTLCYGSMVKGSIVWSVVIQLEKKLSHLRDPYCWYLPSYEPSWLLRVLCVIYFEIWHSFSLLLFHSHWLITDGSYDSSTVQEFEILAREVNRAYKCGYMFVRWKGLRYKCSRVACSFACGYDVILRYNNYVQIFLTEFYHLLIFYLCSCVFTDFPGCEGQFSYSQFICGFRNKGLTKGSSNQKVMAHQQPEMRSPGSHCCSRCGNIYCRKGSLLHHLKWECGKDPGFVCSYCPFATKHKSSLQRHTWRRHKDKIPHIIV